MKKYIYLFRHGQSYFNRDKKFTGWKNSKLTSKGLKDASIVAKKLRNVKIETAFCSSLSRSKNTLKKVLHYHPECKLIVIDDRIIERSYGSLQGKSHKDFILKEGTEDYRTLLHWHKIDHLKGDEKKEFITKLGEAELKIARRSYNVSPPKGESVKQVEIRVRKFIKDLLKLIKKEKVNVAISAHGNSMRPFRRYFEKLKIEEMMELENPYDDYFRYSVNV
jgi:2,3-bisphosphoglycerate-dependent phosphoglycerate mutase